MAITRSIESRANLCVFAETESGFFGFVNNTTTRKKNTCSADTMKIAAVPVSSSSPHVPTRWYGSFLTKYSNSIQIATGGTEAHYIYPSVSTIKYGYGYSITVSDEHGTHYGSPSGTNRPPSQGYAIGVMHNTSDDGWEFIGWKVTIEKNISSYTQPKIESEGGTTEGTVTTFDNGYSGAVIITMGEDHSVKSIAIQAIYQKQSVTRIISLDANGGTVSQSSVQCTDTYANAIAVTPTRDGYEFLGWFDSKEDGNKISSDTELTSTSPSTLYAHWKEIPQGTYLITYNLNGGVDGPENDTVQEGSEYTIPDTAPTRSGYDFIGWQVGTDTDIRQPGYSFIPTGDTVIYAIWNKSGGGDDDRSGYMTYSANSANLTFSISSGHMTYAV